MYIFLRPEHSNSRECLSICLTAEWGLGEGISMCSQNVHLTDEQKNLFPNQD